MSLRKKNIIFGLIIVFSILTLIIISTISRKTSNNLLSNLENIDTTQLSVNEKDTYFDLYEEKVNGYRELEDLYNDGFETSFVEYNTIKQILPQKIKEENLEKENKLIKLKKKNFISISEIKNILGNKKFKELEIGLLKKYNDKDNSIEYTQLLILEKNNPNNIEFIKYY